MANTAKGPWTIATSVPEDIYKIPPSSPSYSVTYVTVQEDEDDDDDWVTYAAYAGYTGLMVGWGCTVWGTGWYYPPYYWYGGYYPIYYPYWRTYGYGAWYNPTQAFMARPDEFMDHTAAPVSALATTRAPEPMLAARSHMDHTARVEPHRHITRAPEPMRRRDRDPMFTAVGDRHTFSGATIG